MNMSVVSTLLAQQVNNWQLEDFACFRKCGEITVSPDAQTYGMNCRFCPGICLQFDVFIDHMREVHAERISALYQQSEAPERSPLGEGKCEQSTQTQTEMETYYGDAGIAAATIDDFDIDVECTDGGDECAFDYTYVDVDVGAGSDTDTDSVANTAQPRIQRYQLRQHRTAVGNGAIEDKPRKVCSWNEAPSAKCNGTLGKFKTLTTTQTPPTPAPTPSPWTTPVQNDRKGGTTVTENASETLTSMASDTPGVFSDASLGLDIDMVDVVDVDVGMNAQNGPEAPHEVDLVYIMESATPDGVIEEETVVDPFEMAQGWRRSTDSSEVSAHCKG